VLEHVDWGYQQSRLPRTWSAGVNASAHFCGEHVPGCHEQLMWEEELPDLDLCHMPISLLP
jgi:hypothetical protein